MLFRERLSQRVPAPMHAMYWSQIRFYTLDTHTYIHIPMYICIYTHVKKEVLRGFYI